MPKRPCAITMSPDSKTIFSADKFGDVYTLPLVPTAEEDEAAREAAKSSSKTWSPAATELTVHSKANLNSLKNQLKQAKENPSVKTKEPLQFAHKLILGHVSMLTDIVISNPSITDGKQYILTADRDEHIRVSRAPPQSFVIEGFCLGHKEFVNRLCLIDDNLLLSAGGDDEVFVWNWQQQKLLFKVSLRKAALDKGIKQDESVEENQPIAVTGLWKFSSQKDRLASFLRGSSISS
jgi:tRNA (guanine-N(7)-)-methyltransferase subunit TRM82